MSRFETVLRTQPFGAEQIVARIPAHWALRRTPMQWLIAMGARVVDEVLARHALVPASGALILIPPEPFRVPSLSDPGHPMASLASRVAERVGADFQRVTQTQGGGAAALAEALDLARQLLGEPSLTYVLVAATDTYVLEADYERLERAGRLGTSRQAQGLTPGEGAACVLLTLPTLEGPHTPGASTAEPTALLTGWAAAHEQDSATSDRYSQGKARVEALRCATQHAGVLEPSLGWILSNDNGERYAAWEATLAHARFFRTRRARLCTVLPAMSVGETGSAGALLALLACAHRFIHAAGQAESAVVELGSEAGGRSACVVVPRKERSP
ncbi:hypothetical protein [Roseateles amylovorans]|uniref:3-oxoacyl-ACP synthase n=1 Tax=Roseateles amylovorans TaxID=2978473 RepID=A0ABY6B038_9BURK|nr:hypothetical protein [Roseateles amylovorans]UXH78779.1 hypothetical protein N4261_02225 [Roseateles amylovorans]